MTAHIEMLESEKQALERRNATVIEENRYLLDQLDNLNTSVVDSDAHVASLQATLLSTQQELHRLSQLAARTERLEQQLADFETEQATWHASLDDKDEAEKSAVRRWQQAERTLAGLQEQIERIEREAKEERERHVEVVGRMERRHAVETELTSAAGRLKGAAAVKTSGRESSGTNVVSHFVKDILQDNANLQLGIMELREMLQNSNDEVENLRHTLEDHQPTGSDAAEESGLSTTRRKDLRDELQRATSQELHVHHHYHAPTIAPKGSTIRRPKKKRYSALTPGHFTPPSGYNTPRSSVSYGTPSSAATILQQTAVSIPQPIPTSNKRLSAQSSQTYHSVPSSSALSSPQSTTNRPSSIFDKVFSDAGHDSSRPTTPDTEDPGSPLSAPVVFRRAGGYPFRTHTAPLGPRRGRSPSAGKLSLDSATGTSQDNMTVLHLADHDAIPEENENDWESGSSAPREEDSSVMSTYSEDALDISLGPAPFSKQLLRRATSHESLISVSGMDIHTLQSRPSQLLTSCGGRSFTTQAVLSEAHAHAAKPTVLSRPSDTSRSLLSGMATHQRQTSRPTFGEKVGGWVFGRWGETPAPSTITNSGNASGETAGKPPSRSTAHDKPLVDPDATPKKAKFRAPGINQAGPIVGFPREVRQQQLPIMRSLDEEALKKALGN